jgi:hypothetical protein
VKGPELRLRINDSRKGPEVAAERSQPRGPALRRDQGEAAGKTAGCQNQDGARPSSQRPENACPSGDKQKRCGRPQGPRGRDAQAERDYETGEWPVRKFL